MGKSLSILALITKSLDEASRWAHGQEFSAPAADALEHRSHATLVIVPSASMSQRPFHNSWATKFVISFDQPVV